MPQEESLDFKLVQRVCLLQQALDQALYSLEDLKEQVQDQQWLESQLATTEKYANVQEQAIAYLRSQLTHLNTTQPSLLQHMAGLLDDWVDHQQSTLNRLQFQIQQGEMELQSYLQHVRDYCQDGQNLAVTDDTQTLELEAEVMVARSMAVSLGGQLQSARYYVQTLAAMVHHHHADLAHLTGALQTTLTAIAETTASEAMDSETSDPTDQAGLERLNTPIPEDEVITLRHALRVQQVRIHELETALADQLGRQTQLKQRCQTLAAERDHYKRQVDDRQGQAVVNRTPIAPPDLSDVLSDPGLPDPGLSAPWQRRRRLHPPSPIQPLKIQGE
ncbi:MAG: hypothetical protein O3A14_06155 [Cyanobacteria bacterium]|nr:hypothetical protein [Cyanobacteriota bacterium]